MSVIDTLKSKILGEQPLLPDVDDVLDNDVDNLADAQEYDGEAVEYAPFDASQFLAECPREEIDLDAEN